uniref:Uncharacterized protein n=1 Tax=Romanomermis culicivorax TaxID=13658 RepID=A0A915IQ24_ROMCU
MKLMKKGEDDQQSLRNLCMTAAQGQIKATEEDILAPQAKASYQQNILLLRRALIIITASNSTISKCDKESTR